jgi:hypothetical protein
MNKEDYLALLNLAEEKGDDFAISSGIMITEKELNYLTEIGEINEDNYEQKLQGVIIKYENGEYGTLVGENDEA